MHRSQEAHCVESFDDGHDDEVYVDVDEAELSASSSRNGNRELMKQETIKKLVPNRLDSVDQRSQHEI